MIEGHLTDQLSSPKLRLNCPKLGKSLAVGSVGGAAWSATKGLGQWYGSVYMSLTLRPDTCASKMQAERLTLSPTAGTSHRGSWCSWPAAPTNLCHANKSSSIS